MQRHLLREIQIDFIMANLSSFLSIFLLQLRQTKFVGSMHTSWSFVNGLSRICFYRQISSFFFLCLNCFFFFFFFFFTNFSIINEGNRYAYKKFMRWWAYLANSTALITKRTQIKSRKPEKINFLIFSLSLRLYAEDI